MPLKGASRAGGGGRPPHGDCVPYPGMCSFLPLTHPGSGNSMLPFFPALSQLPGLASSRHFSGWMEGDPVYDPIHEICTSWGDRLESCSSVGLLSLQHLAPRSPSWVLLPGFTGDPGCLGLRTPRGAGRGPGSSSSASAFPFLSFWARLFHSVLEKGDRKI